MVPLGHRWFLRRLINTLQLHFLKGCALNPICIWAKDMLLPFQYLLSSTRFPPHSRNLTGTRNGLWVLAYKFSWSHFSYWGFFFFFSSIVFNILVAVVETFVLWRVSHSRPRVRFLSRTLNIFEGSFFHQWDCTFDAFTQWWLDSALRHPRTPQEEGKGSRRKSRVSGTQWEAVITVLLWAHYFLGFFFLLTP